MAISVECPSCHTLNGTGRSACSKCGYKLVARGIRYWLRYRDLNGNSKKESLGPISLREARNIEVQRVGEVKSQRRVNSDLTWLDLSNRYMSKLRAENASQRYLVDSQRFFERMIDYFGTDSIQSTTPSIIRSFRSELRNAGLSEASCDRHLSAGKAAWNYAVDDLPNPFSRVKMYNPDNEVVRFLTDDERQKLLEAAIMTHQKLYEMLVVTISTGMRKSNVLNLRRSEVDFETGIILVKQKGGLSHTTIMNESCRETLEAIPPNETDYFWITKQGTPYRVDWRKPWERAKRLAGISKDFRWHDLRHDAGTRIYAATGDIYATQIFLGHRQTNTTKRYAHFLKDKLQATADVLLTPLCKRVPSRVLPFTKKA